MAAKICKKTVFDPLQFEYLPSIIEASGAKWGKVFYFPIGEE